MKKLSMLGIVGGAALLTTVPFSLQWSQKNVALSFDSAEARIGRAANCDERCRASAEGFTEGHIGAQFTEPQWLDLYWALQYGYSRVVFGPLRTETSRLLAGFRLLQSAAYRVLDQRSLPHQRTAHGRRRTRAGQPHLGRSLQSKAMSDLREDRFELVQGRLIIPC